jgi:ribosomal protein S18 acetylase RimI-like enzyme
MDGADIQVAQLDRQRLADLRNGDGWFTADARLVIAAENDVISYTTAAIPPFPKRYPPDRVDPACYIDNPDKAIFIAYLRGQAAGQIRLCRYWNQYAYVEDIAVDPASRKQGIGERLLRAAIDWAKRNRLPGVMLETQNINTVACRLYQRCGFTLGGFDRFLYQGLQPGTPEIALYWYLIFEHQS